MDSETDCPICFECYDSSAQRERREVPCCGQYLCCNCGDVLRRCPFCRATWVEEDDAEHQPHPWLRFRCPNPVAVAVTSSIIRDVVTSGTARSIAGAGLAGFRAAGQALCGVARVGAAAIAEASPAVTVGAVAGTAAIAGTVAIAVASQHSDAQAQQLQNVIRSRRQRSLGETPWYEAAGRLWEATQWYLSPQKVGLHKGTHVYHGSPWFCREREQHLSQIRAICVDVQADVSDGTSRDVLWSDLCFCFSLWLDYNPHTANWGYCPSYGLSPFYLCWHNRWREDLRHVASDLARRIQGDTELRNSISSKERACALCLLATLDHVLSWDVDTPDFGKSDLIESEWFLYRSFCQKLQDTFLKSWAMCQGHGNLDESASCDLVVHVERMAEREVPPGFRDIW